MIHIDRQLFTRLAIRRSILSSNAASTCKATPAAHDAVTELYTFLVDPYLPTRFPSMFQLDEKIAQLVNSVSGDTYPLNPPADTVQILRTMGTLVDEDFMFLLPSPDGDGYNLQAYVTCFTSGFELEKIFESKLRDIHRGVPGYRQNLETSMDRWFSKLEAGRYMCRNNVSFSVACQRVYFLFALQ